MFWDAKQLFLQDRKFPLSTLWLEKLLKDQNYDINFNSAGG